MSRKNSMSCKGISIQPQAFNFLRARCWTKTHTSKSLQSDTRHTASMGEPDSTHTQQPSTPSGDTSSLLLNPKPLISMLKYNLHKIWVHNQGFAIVLDKDLAYRPFQLFKKISIEI